jgi:small subunit ribosomal protein S3
VGQKTNPIAFRSIINRKYFSNWYSLKKNYPKNILSDYKIRNLITQIFSTKNFVSAITINKIFVEKMSAEQLDISFSIYPNLVTSFFKKQNKKEAHNNAENLIFDNMLAIKKKKLNFVLKKNGYRNVRLHITKASNVLNDPFILASYVRSQLEARISVRKIFNKIIDDAEKDFYIKGLKLQAAGRLNFAEKAQKEWKRYGSTPLHTMSANVEYAALDSYTSYGIIGIKVWIFR